MILITIYIDSTEDNTGVDNTSDNTNSITQFLRLRSIFQ